MCVRSTVGVPHTGVLGSHRGRPRYSNWRSVHLLSDEGLTPPEKVQGPKTEKDLTGGVEERGFEGSGISETD